MSAGEVPPAAADDPLIGKLISERYRVIQKLGEGGMGAVYLAEHVVIEKRLALKVLAPDLARRQDLVARFLQEARSASRIGHENVIDISDFGQSPDGFVYIAMEFLDGADLGAAIRRDGPLPWTRAKPIVLQLCRALRAAHEKGIVHRDMKPENIFLIQREGRPDFVKLLDFGIAKVISLTGENTPRLTRTGMIFGTPEYMAPEQAEGKDSDHRVDVYAVGCVMYHLISGDPPFKADSFMATLTKHLLEDPVPPSARRPDLGITPELDGMILKALEKNRDDRWQSMQEMMDAVQTCASGTGQRSVAPGTATRPLGGSGAAAMRAAISGARAAQSALDIVAPRESLLDDLDDRLRSPSRRGIAPRGMLAVAGLIVVTAIALWTMLRPSQRSTKPPLHAGAASVPSPTSGPTPSPTPPPAIETPPAARAGDPDNPKHPPARANRTDKRGYRRIVVPEEEEPPAPRLTPPTHPASPASAPSRKPATPPELKPFPL